MNDLIITFIILIYNLLIISLNLIMYYKKIIKAGLARNLIHLFAGLSIFSLYFIENKYYLLVTSILMTFLVFLSRSKTPILNLLFKAIHEKEEKKYLKGPLLYCISITLLIIFSIITNNIVIPIISALVLIISDPLAAIIGKRFGKHKILLSFTQSVRSIEGSLAMFISNIIIFLFFFPFSWTLVIVSFFITLSELVSVSKYDDFIVPIVTLILLLFI